jgi:hypothetical protein
MGWVCPVASFFCHTHARASGSSAAPARERLSHRQQTYAHGTRASPDLLHAAKVKAVDDIRLLALAEHSPRLRVLTAGLESVLHLLRQRELELGPPLRGPAGGRGRARERDAVSGGPIRGPASQAAWTRSSHPSDRPPSDRCAGGSGWRGVAGGWPGGRLHRENHNAMSMTHAALRAIDSKQVRGENSTNFGLSNLSGCPSGTERLDPIQKCAGGGGQRW